MIVRAEILYDGSLDEPKRNVDVVIEGERVREIRPIGNETPDHYAQCATPGLVNAHAHLEMSGEPDTMGELARMSHNERLIHAIENARKTLRAGVTTVRDLGSSGDISIAVRDAVEQGRVPGPRIRAAGRLICMTGGHGWFVGRPVDGPWDARKAVREQLHAGADCIKVIATGGVLTKGAVPGNAQLLPEELEAAIDEAHRHGLRVAAHAIGTQGIKNALRAGVDSIEHGHLLDDEAIELFLEHDTALVPTLAAPTCIMEHLHEGKQPEFVIRKAETINDAMATTIRKAFHAGVRIAGGSDAGTPYNAHHDYAFEIELMHSILGMTRQQALHAATAVAADLLGLHRGMIAAGEPADLLLLDGDAGADLRVLRKPKAVLKAGAVVA